MAKTAQQIFDLACGFMGITSDVATSYSGAFLPQLNLILANNLELENNNRRYKNLTLVTPLALLTDAPTVTALGDSIDYQNNVLTNVIVYGVAQLMALSDEDTIRAGMCETRYIDGQDRESKLIPSEITDAYYGVDE